MPCKVWDEIIYPFTNFNGTIIHVTSCRYTLDISLYDFLASAHSSHYSLVMNVDMESLSGVPDFFDRNKILSGYDLSHYQVPPCIRVFFYFVWFVFIHHNFQFYFKLCTYCNILDIYLSYNLNFVNYLLFYMKLLNYLFFNMFGSVLECCELTGVSLLWPWLIKWK